MPGIEVEDEWLAERMGMHLIEWRLWRRKIRDAHMAEQEARVFALRIGGSILSRVLLGIFIAVVL